MRKRLKNVTISSVSNLKLLKTNHGQIKFPTFFPDGTRAVVKGGVDSLDLEAAKVEGLVINTYHLLCDDLNSKIQNVPGVHEFMHWKGPIITDSGGFQVMSLIYDNPGLGKITDEKITFKLPKSGKRVILTPEVSIDLQLKLGSDITIVLDDCTRPDQSESDQVKSVERTITWAKRSKAEFEKQTKGKKKKPLLFGIVQGGNSFDLRKECAKELVKIGFDGYCYGGFPVDKEGNFLSEVLEFVAKQLPEDKALYAMGIGRPENIVESFKIGYGLFDCVIPTREARHKKLYVFGGDPNKLDILGEDFYSTIHFGSAKYENDMSPVSNFCDCLTCQHYSKAYLRHLFKVGDMLAFRLASIHNLRFYSMLLEQLKQKGG